MWTNLLVGGVVVWLVICFFREAARGTIDDQGGDF